MGVFSKCHDIHSSVIKSLSGQDPFEVDVRLSTAQATLCIKTVVGLSSLQKRWTLSSRNIAAEEVSRKVLLLASRILPASVDI